MNRFVAVALSATLWVAGAAPAVDIVWDGGDGAWNNIPGKWNGGQLSIDVFGRSNGIEIGSGELGPNAYITSGNVSYDPVSFGDFRLKGNATLGDPSLFLSGGTVFSMDSYAGDVDGKWTQYDGNLHMDNATFRRTRSGSVSAGGAFIFGSWRTYNDQVINVTMTNNSRIENDGQIWFGAYGDNKPGLKVLWTVDGNSSISNTNGLFSQDDSAGAEGEINFIYGWDDTTNAPKGEEYAINFTGPGSITVDWAGIRIQDEIAPGVYNSLDASYQDLWDRGILQANGFSGAKRVSFGPFFSVNGAQGTPGYQLVSNVQAPVDIVWDGGDGEWNDLGGKWNGGQQSIAVFGRSNGLEVGSGEVGYNIVINDGDVTYAAHDFGDFRLKSGGTINISNGASLTVQSIDSDVDGKWTQYDGDGLNVDNGTFRRVRGGTSLAGGALIFGSWRSYNDQVIEINLSNGGTIDNNGQIWFGAYGDNRPGLQVLTTIDGGHIINTNGSFSQDDSAGAEGEINFIYGWDNDTGGPKNENYVINFVGGGSITVDAAGIRIQEETAPNVYNSINASYQDLWDRCILQANGECGLTGATFGDYFTVNGTQGSDGYQLVSLLGGVSGDFNSDGQWNLTDIDLLTAAIATGSTDLAFDMNGDGSITLADITDTGSGWLAVGGANNAGATGGNSFLVGDANLSGAVDVSDFNAWNGAKFTSVAAWSAGDFNADGVVDVSDFNLWNGTKFTSSSGLAAVPEPASLVTLLIALAGVAVLRRK